MRKIYLIGLALLAVFAYGAVMTAAAFAEDDSTSEAAEWLVVGRPLVAGEKLALEVEGELLLIDLKAPLVGTEVDVHCTSGIFDGETDGPNFALITDVLTLNKVSVQLPNAGILCTGEKTCEKIEDVEVWAEQLPWLASLYLMAGTEELFLILLSEDAGFGGLPAYEVLCLVFGAETEVLCEGETSAWLSLDAGTPPLLLGTFSAAELEADGLEGSCGGVANLALVEGNGVIRLVSGEELSVSSGTKEA